MQNKNLGFGLGLRPKHYTYIIENQPPVDWFEIISEDYLVDGGRHFYYLEKIREKYPIVMHGVSMSIGSLDPLDKAYLKQLKKLAQRIQPQWISDHLCWTGVHGKNTHDLLPVPYTEEALSHVVNRVIEVQDYLGTQILLENPSTYITFKDSLINEWDFMNAVAKQADCKILLDINNIYVSAFNHGFDAREYLNNITIDRVQQFHLAGHCNKGTHIIDTHDADIIDEVWTLYKEAWQRFGPVATMIERDDNIPEFTELFEELMQAKSLVLDEVNAS